MVEGLSGFIKRANYLGLFLEFRVGSSNLVVSHLKYANDTLILAKPFVENLWSIKVILSGFGLASDPQVIFSKSILNVINVKHEFLDPSWGFIHCRIESLPFMYLGLPVGESPRLENT